MKFEVLKPFTWAGQDLKVGETLEIPDESPKIGSLARSKFIRVASALPKFVSKELPKVEEVVQEMGSEEKGRSVEVAATRDPKEIIRQAKAKAAAKK